MNEKLHKELKKQICHYSSRLYQSYLNCHGTLDQKRKKIHKDRKRLNNRITLSTNLA